MSGSDKKKVVVIGAGPAGLTAAHELLSRAADEYDVTVLEESQTVGGISRTVVHDGNRMDIGGHRFFSKEHRVTDWWAKRMPAQGAPSLDDRILGRESTLVDGGPDPQTQDRVMLTRSRVSRIYYDHKFFDYPISLSPKTLKAMGPATTAAVGASYMGAQVKKLPEDSLENFYVNRFGHKLYSMFFEGYTEKLWGRHPREISADWGSQRVKGLSIVALLKDAVAKAVGRKNAANTETSLIERFQYPKFGPGQLWEEAATEVEELGGRVLYGQRAVHVDTAQNDMLTSVTAVDSDGAQTVFEADYVLSTMPLKDLAAAMSDVPEDVARIAAGLPYRDFVTVGLLVDRLELKNETDIPTLGNIVPDNWIYVQDTGVKLGRIQVFNNWSPYLVADPEHTVWVGLEYFCAEGDDFWTMGDADRVQMATGELRRMGVLGTATEVLDSHVEHVKKAYPAYFDTYSQIDELIAWLDVHPNLFCLGRNGQHRYNNMDHSMMTAFYAVDDILSGSDDRSNVWNVNTETDYHEQAEAGEDDAANSKNMQASTKCDACSTGKKIAIVAGVTAAVSAVALIVCRKR
jgi:protoporphyrinogen oxidase